MSSRAYVKRVWRVPKDRGASTYLAALVHKALVKHGWPAKVQVVPRYLGDGFQILHVTEGWDARDDFWEAAQVASRIVARTHRVDVEITDRGLVMFNRAYRVTSGGLFKEQSS